MGVTDTREVLIANSQFGGGVTTWAPATWYVALSTTTPNDDGTNFTEPVGGAYARKSVTNDATQWPTATTVSGVTTKSNGAKITFVNPTGAWGAITYYGIFTALTGGLPEYTGLLDSSITVQSGNTPVEFDIGQLVIAWD